MCKSLPLWLAALSLAACAGPQLRETAIEMGPSFGSLQERQIINNLGRYLNQPWSIPGQIDVTSGSLQVQNQASLSFKLPYIATAAQEADPSVQSQEQDSFVISPVTDGDDLRRVRALYEYAVCHDSRKFRREWEETITPYEIANKKAQQTDTAASPDAKRALDALNARITQLKKDVANLQKQKKDAQDEIDKKKAAKVTGGATVEAQLDFKDPTILALDTKITSANSEVNQLTVSQSSLASTVQSSATSAAATPPAPNSSPADSVELERAKKDLIVSVIGGSRFVYWTDTGSNYTQKSPCATVSPAEAAPPFNAQFYRLGSAGGFDFWTDQPDKVAQFMMFVIGSTPNTSGVHALTSKASGNSPSKAQSTPFVFYKTN